MTSAHTWEACREKGERTSVLEATECSDQGLAGMGGRLESRPGRTLCSRLWRLNPVKQCVLHPTDSCFLNWVNGSLQGSDADNINSHNKLEVIRTVNNKATAHRCNWPCAQCVPSNISFDPKGTH